MSDEKRNTDATKRRAKARRRRRSPSDNDVKMHVRIPRAQAEAFAAEAERRNVTLRQLVLERLVPPPDAIDARRLEIARHLGQIALFGGDALERTMKALTLCAPEAFTHMALIGSAVVAAYELGRAPTTPTTPTPTPTPLLLPTPTP